MSKEYLYRFDSFLSSSIEDSEYGHHVTSIVEVCLFRYEILRKTPKGVWIYLNFGDEKFVLSNARKRYACPTIEEAKESFKARKSKEIKILQARIDHAKEAITIIDRRDWSKHWSQ
jgi:hypothetical protein